MPNTEEDVTNITTASEESIQKKQSKSSLAHTEKMILGKKVDPIRTRYTFRNTEESLMGLVYVIEPTSIDKSLLDIDWILAMQ